MIETKDRVCGCPITAADLRRDVAAIERDAMAQAVAAVKRSSQTPVVVLHESGRRHDSDIVMLRLRDFEDLWGPLWKESEETA